jgi:hypothetical protein
LKRVQRQRPKIDRIVYPWLTARFIDSEPAFLYVSAGEVMIEARRTGAVPARRRPINDRRS